MGLFLNQGLRIPDETISPGAGRRRRMPVHHREIDALRRSGTELRLQRRLGLAILRKQYDAGRITIDAMDDERLALTVRSQMRLDLFDDRDRVLLSLERNREDACWLVDGDDPG